LRNAVLVTYYQSGGQEKICDSVSKNQAAPKPPGRAGVKKMKTKYGHHQQTRNVYINDACRRQTFFIMAAYKQINKSDSQTQIYACAPLAERQQVAADCKRPGWVLAA
jgi:hypothetical protein